MAITKEDILGAFDDGAKQIFEDEIIEAQERFAQKLREYYSKCAVRLFRNVNILHDTDKITIQVNIAEVRKEIKNGNI